MRLPKFTHETMNKWRVWPRMMITLYGYHCHLILEWYIKLPDPTTNQTAFATGIWGAAAVWFGFYVNSGGGNWNASAYMVPPAPLQAPPIKQPGKQ